MDKGWLFLDTNVWSHVLRTAPREDRRTFIHSLDEMGLRLGWSPELLAEVGRTTDDLKRREIGETILELAMDTGVIPPNHIVFGREVCEALARDHPDWVGEPLLLEERRYRVAYQHYLGEIARGQPVESMAEELLTAIADDKEIHVRVRAGDYVLDPRKTAGDLSPEQVLLYVREAAKRPHLQLPEVNREKRPPIHTPKGGVVVRLKIELLRAMIDAFDVPPVDYDGRGFVTRRLSSSCDALAFTRWVWTEMRSSDLPSYTLSVAVSLGQVLDGHLPSNLLDRAHAELLTRVRIFVTSDRKFYGLLTHPRLREWIPQGKAMLLPLRPVPTLDDLAVKLRKHLTAGERSNGNDGRS
jgi:hypothetical protein